MLLALMGSWSSITAFGGSVVMVALAPPRSCFVLVFSCFLCLCAWVDTRFWPGKCISAKASVFFCCVHLPPCIVQSSFC